MKKKKYNISKKFLIKEYIKNKKSMKQIAKQIKCSIKPIRNGLIKYSIPIRTKSEVHIKYKIFKSFLIKKYIRDKESIYKISKEINCNASTIRAKLIKYNIKIRTRSEAQKGINRPSGKNHPCYNPEKHKEHYCIDCGKKIGYGSKRCSSCANKISGIRRRKIKTYPKCLICGKMLSAYNCKYCKSCFGKIRMIKNWKNFNFRNKIIKASMEARKLKPNNIEKELHQFLSRILYKQYKFVGDGKVILGGFNPDFINCNGQKKIIELYGDYWHNREIANQRDKRRLTTYKKYGYKTLIIWEKELKNKTILIKKILGFHNE